MKFKSTLLAMSFSLTIAIPFIAENALAHEASGSPPISGSDCIRPGQLLLKPGKNPTLRQPTAADYLTLIAKAGSYLALADCEPRIARLSAGRSKIWMVIRAEIELEGISTYYSARGRIWKTKLSNQSGDYYINPDGLGLCMDTRYCRLTIQTDDVGGIEIVNTVFLKIWDNAGPLHSDEVIASGKVRWLRQEKLQQIY